MDRNELLKHLTDYSSNVSSRTASTQDFIDIKNKIRAAYDAGNLDQETMKLLSDKASGSFKNMGKTPELANLPAMVVEKGGSIGAPEGMKSRFTGVKNILSKAGTAINEDAPKSNPLSMVKGSGGFAKMLPMLGLGAAGLAGLSIAGKVQAGELGQAGLESADLATDYVPGLGQAKMALRPTELGNAELPPEEMEARRVYNEARMAGQTGAPSLEQPLLEPEDRAKKEEMDALFKNVRSRVK